MTASLSLERLSYETGGRLLVDRADLTAAPGETVGLVGPNGSGKTTLLRCVYGTLRPARGRALLDGRDLHTMPPKERARRVATVPQDGGTEFELTVREVVAMGRSPHKRFWEADTAADTTLADEALAQVGIADLALRAFPTLSGGERQRALVARALVQRPALLVLDEPTNHLDISHQLGILTLIERSATTSLLALHDLNLAAHYCDRIYVLRAGRIVASGTPHDVLTPALLDTVYGVKAEVSEHPVTGRPLVVYLPPST
ncbi:ABC transporter ATP-binding protein [Streptomyces sp. SID1121]|uniref:ABC transporter ATP-binding protein n=1 Tax=Streptomyces sp. SID1121 TaxID=3425888 RepID=UPI004057AA96